MSCYEMVNGYIAFWASAQKSRVYDGWMEWILDVPIRLLWLQITCGAKPCIMYITSTYGVYDVDSIPTPAVAALYLLGRPSEFFLLGWEVPLSSAKEKGWGYPPQRKKSAKYRLNPWFCCVFGNIFNQHVPFVIIIVVRVQSPPFCIGSKLIPIWT